MCQSCNVSGHEGACTAQPSGADLHDDCIGSCDGNGACAPGSFAWQAWLNGTSYTKADGMALDSVGNVYLVGQFAGTLNVGAPSPVAQGDADAFLAKLDPAGQLLWVRGYGAAGGLTEATAVAVDRADNVVVGGTFNKPIDFGTGTLTPATPGNDAFLFELKKDGTSVAWSKAYGSADTFLGDAIHSIAITANGYILVAGVVDAHINLGCPTGTLDGNGQWDGFVAKLDSAATCQWGMSVGDGSLQSADAVAVDADGNAIVTGRFGSSITFAGCPMLTGGGGSAWDAFVAKLGPDGGCLWAKAFIDAEGASVAVDSLGNVAVGGSFQGVTDFGNGSPVTNHGKDAYVVVLDASGAYSWSHAFGDGSEQRTASVTFDATGNAYVVGALVGSADIGGATLTSSGSSDGFVAVYGPGGGLRWGKHFGDSAAQEIDVAAIAPSGALLLFGAFNGNISFGGPSLTATGGRDLFAVALQP